jgi:hypothetical protein
VTRKYQLAPRWRELANHMDMSFGAKVANAMKVPEVRAAVCNTDSVVVLQHSHGLCSCRQARPDVRLVGGTVPHRRQPEGRADTETARRAEPSAVDARCAGFLLFLAPEKVASF